MTLHRVYRKSGLVRQLDARDVFLINTFGYALGIALTINPGLIGGFSPSANIHIVLTLGLVAALFNGFTYGLFASVMPKTGGDFIYVTTSLGRWIGFLASFGFTAAQLYGFALNSFWAFKQGLAPALATYGMVQGRAEIVRAATFVGTDRTSMYLGLGLMILLFLISLFGLGLSKQLLVVSFLAGLCGPVFQLYAFFSVDHKTFIALYNNFITSQHLTGLDYQSVIAAGRAQHLLPDAGRMLPESLKALPLGFLTFLGFTYSAYMGSEVREASKSQLKGILWALACGAGFFYFGMGRYYHVVGNDFNAAISANSLNFPSGNSLAFFAGIILRNPAANAVMNIGNLLWFILVPFVILQVCSRNIQVWSVEYVFPRFIAGTNRYEAPAAAAFVALLAGVGFLLLAELVLHNTNPIGAVALSALSILLSGVSAIIYSGRLKARSHLEKRSLLFNPRAFRFFGWGTAIVFGWVTVAAALFPAISGLTTGGEWPVVVKIIIGVYGLGSMIFYGYRRILISQLKNEGLTLEEIWGHLLDE